MNPIPADFPLILRALRKHKIVAALVALQIATASAIVGNGLNLLSQRLLMQSLPTGMTEDRLLALEVDTLQGQLDDAQREEVVAAIAAHPGVSSVSHVNALPFTHSTSNTVELINGDGSTHPPQTTAWLYYGSPDFLRTLGLRFVAGSNFESVDFSADGSTNFLATSKKIILSQSLARRLSVQVGSLLQIYGNSMTVIGIVADAMPPSLASPDDIGQVAFIPVKPTGILSSTIIVNMHSPPSDDAIADVVGIATRNTPSDFAWSARRLSDIRAQYFKMDRMIGRIVIALMAMLGLIVAGGIGGLSSYWIQRRYKQIATRRALGACKADIAHYFHVENFIVSLVGATIGLAGAMALSLLLARWMSLPQMPILPPLLGGVLMILIGQIAVYFPIRKALRVEPTTLRNG